MYREEVWNLNVKNWSKILSKKWVSWEDQQDIQNYRKNEKIVKVIILQFVERKELPMTWNFKKNSLK